MKVPREIPVRAHTRTIWQRDPYAGKPGLFGEDAIQEPKRKERTMPRLEGDGTLGMLRRSDPGTSRAAARSILPKMNETRAYVLAMLRELEPCTDETLVEAIGNEMAPSAVRSRRAELVTLGKVRDSGMKKPLKSGRDGIAWEVTLG